MKKYFILFLFFPFCMSTTSLLFSEETKFTAAVMDLTAEQGVSESAARMLSDYLRTQLFNTGKFILVTRESMEQVLKEQQFQLSGCTSQECIVQVGQLLGVRKMFTGSIGKIGATYMLTLKSIDVQSGQIEKAVTEECAECKEDALIVSVRNIAKKIAGIAVVQSPEEKPISKGKLSIVSTPDSANVYLNGEKIGITPILEYELPEGRYNVLLEKAGCETQVSPIKILPDKITVVKPILKIQTGSVNIISNPEGAQVFLNGEYKGLTPFTLSDIPVGEYSVRLELKDYEPIEQKVAISYKEEAKLIFDLKIQVGSINIISHPEGAQVFLNGEYKGLTPFVLSDIFVGEYSITLKLKNYKTVKQKMAISYNKETKLEFTLYQTEPISPNLGGRFGVGLNYPGIQARYGITDSLLLEGKAQFSSNNTTVGGRIYYLFMKIPGSVAILPYVGGSFSWVFSPYLRYGGYVTGGFVGTELMVSKNIGLGADAGLYYVSLTSSLGTYTDYGLLFNVGLTYYF